MKRIKLLVFLLISFFIFNLRVFAGANISVNPTNVTIGDSFKVSVKMNNVAAWNIHVSSSGPVSDCSIHQADATADALDISKTLSVTCKATGVGSVTLTLSGDVTSAKDGIPVMLSGTAIVQVKEKSLNTNNNQSENNLSKNNKIKILSVEGFELSKVDNNNYTLLVNNDVNSIKINAVPEDSKAEISGVGSHKLKIGENEFEIIVTSESGLKNRINIKVTRKDGYYLEDLESLLKDSKSDTIDIIINSDSKVSSEYLTKIKNSGKVVNFNYYDENKKLIYSWSVDGSKINEIREFVTLLSYKSEKFEEISNLSNYADGLYISFEHSGILPKGIKIKLYVGDKFDNGKIVNLYHYEEDSKKLVLTKDKINVKEGYIEFDIEKCFEYFITMSNIGIQLNLGNQLEQSPYSLFNMVIIISLVELIIIIILIILLIRVKLFNKKNNFKNENMANVSENNNNVSYLQNNSVGGNVSSVTSVEIPVPMQNNPNIIYSQTVNVSEDINNNTNYQ